MRILIVTPTFLPAWGGAERLLYEVFCRLAQRHTIHVVAPVTPDQAVNHQAELLLESLPFTVSRYTENFRCDRVRGRRIHQGFFPPFELSAIPTVSRETVAFKPDVLSAFYAIPTGLAGLVSKWRHRTPMVLSYVGRDVPGPHSLPGWKYYDRLLAKAADATTYISDYCRTAIFGKSHRGPGVTVGNGAQEYETANENKVRALREKLGLSPNTQVLFALQRLSIYKGVDVLINSMQHLKDLPCVLLVAGSGVDKQRLETMVDEHGLADKVRLLGFVPEEDLPSYWGLADLFVFHSYYETFGMVVAEAMRAGKAVVSVRSTAIPEVVRDNKDGLLVEPGNAEDLAGAVRLLVGDAGLRAKLAASGRARAESEFNWDRVAGAYEAVFEDVHSNRQR